MKLHYVLLKVLLSVFIFIFSYSCQSQVYKHKSKTKRSSQLVVPEPVDPSVIKTLNYSFRNYLASHPDLTFHPNYDYIKVPANTINRILDNHESSFVFAVMGVDYAATKKELQIDFVGSNTDGTRVSDQTVFKPDAETHNRHNGLKDKHNRSNRLPLIGLNDFPVVIKMDTASLWRIRRAPHDRFYYFYPGIDASWKDGANDDNSVHFTVSVLGTTLTKNRFAAVAGEETWPRSSFVWYSSFPIGGL